MTLADYLTAPLQWRVYLPTWGEVCVVRQHAGKPPLQRRVSTSDLASNFYERAKRNQVTAVVSSVAALALGRCVYVMGVFNVLDPARDALGFASWEYLETSYLAGELSAYKAFTQAMKTNGPLLFGLFTMFVQSRINWEADEDEDGADGDVDSGEAASDSFRRFGEGRSLASATGATRPVHDVVV